MESHNTIEYRKCDSPTHPWTVCTNIDSAVFILLAMYLKIDGRVGCTPVTWRAMRAVAQPAAMSPRSQRQKARRISHRQQYVVDLLREGFEQAYQHYRQA
eukprot:COSAG05_NODE_159_length_15652_cov_14.134636_6_plen_100_part_00